MGYILKTTVLCKHRQLSDLLTPYYTVPVVLPCNMCVTREDGSELSVTKEGLFPRAVTHPHASCLVTE